MNNSLLSYSQALREQVAQRWWAAAFAARCIQMELPSAVIRGIFLTPHGFGLEIQYDGSFSESWLPLIQRHAVDLPAPEQIHPMIATNAAGWLANQGQVFLAQELALLGKAEVSIVEWEDGRVNWLPGVDAIPEYFSSWVLTTVQVEPDPERKGFERIALEGIVAQAPDKLRKQEKEFKKFHTILEGLIVSDRGAVLGAPATAMAQLWLDWSNQAIPMALVSPDVTRVEGIEELAEGWVRDFSKSSAERRELPKLGALGAWNGDAGAAWGDLLWQVEDPASFDVMTDWLQFVQQRLKLLGFEYEIVAQFEATSSSKAGDVVTKEGAQWLLRWAKRQGLAIVPQKGFDVSHDSEPWGGPSLEWRVFDPLGASWPFARLGVSVEAKALWVKQWQRHFNRQAQREAALVEQRAAQLKDGRWLMASACVDVEQEARLSQIWRCWTAKAKGSR